MTADAPRGGRVAGVESARNASCGQEFGLKWRRCGEQFRFYTDRFSGLL
jgi:hypothetical protein